MGLLINRGSALGLPDRVLEFKSGATTAAGDLLNIESGVLAVAGTGDFILGQGLESSVNLSTGVQVNCVPGLIVVMDNDNVGTTFAVTHVGARFDITGLTDAQLVDTSSVDTSATAPTGTLVCMAYNPQNTGRSDLNTDISVGLFTIYEMQLNG